MAQLALNDKKSDTTMYIPFFANYGRNLNLFLELLDAPKTQRALENVNELKRVHIQLSVNILFQNQKTAK